MENKIRINCSNCGKEFEKSAKEHRRQIKQGNTRFFCTSSCAAIKNNSEIKRKGNPEFLISSNRLDEFSPFRKFVSKAKYRDSMKNYGCDITIEYLKDLWEEQNGICPFTGWFLILPKDSNLGFEQTNPANASLDRIDNDKGYVRGNVRFVAFIANIARQNFTDDQLKDFCKAVADKGKLCI